jgi:hypothetical protein
MASLDLSIPKTPQLGYPHSNYAHKTLHFGKRVVTITLQIGVVNCLSHFYVSRRFHLVAFQEFNQPLS